MAFASGTNPFGCSSAIRAFSSCSNLSPAQVRRGVHLRDVLRLSHSIGNYPNKTFEQVYDDYLTKLKTEGTFYLERIFRTDARSRSTIDLRKTAAGS